MSSPKLHLKILDRKRRAMLPKLAFLKKRGFYLAGGTALALQLGHRHSEDFDYYAPKMFNPTMLQAEFEKRFNDITSARSAWGTLNIDIGGIHLSFFYYDFPLLRPLLETPDLFLTSVEDIAAMKLLAIMQRGKKRDFIDLHYLLKQHSLEQIIGWTEKKFKGYDPYIALRALTYFGDADHDKSRFRLRLVNSLSWPAVKKHLILTVGQYTKEHMQ